MDHQSKDIQSAQQERAACHIKTSIGGQALIEGIMMRGPQKTAMAVRNPQGEIVLEQWETSVTARPRLLRLPFVRGIFNFVDTMRFGYKCLMRSAEIAGLDQIDEPDRTPTDEQTDAVDRQETVPTADTTAAADSKAQDGQKKESSFMMGVIMTVSTVLAILLAVTLFIWLPSQLYAWLPDTYFAPDNRYLKSVFEGVCKVVLLIGYMSLVSLMKDIRRTFMYHGAEHKTIFCYEAGLELTVENVRSMKRFHPRCGTSFLILMVLVSIVVGFFIPPHWATPLRVLLKLVLIPVIVGIGYELIKFAGRHDNILTRVISLPGVLLQRLTVFEPEDDMIECAITALKTVIPEDGSDRW